MSQTFYKTYELVQRLDAIPTVEIQTFEEPYLENQKYISTITVHFPDEFDETAYERLQEVIGDASHWEQIDTHADKDSIVLHFEIDQNAPTELLSKFDLI